MFFDDFDSWWKAHGRFIPPLDQITNTDIVNQFYNVAKAAFEEAYGCTEAFAEQKYEEGMADAIMNKQS